MFKCLCLNFSFKKSHHFQRVDSLVKHHSFHVIYSPIFPANSETCRWDHHTTIGLSFHSPMNKLENANVKTFSVIMYARVFDSFLYTRNLIKRLTDFHQICMNEALVHYTELIGLC